MLERTETHSDAELQVQTNTLFPTTIFRCMLEQSAAFNAALLSAIHGIKIADEEGQKKSNYPELGGWHSQNNLHKTSGFQEFVQIVNDMGEHISSKHSYSPSHHIAISSMWAIINGKGSFNRVHVHPGSDWSGVYYVKTPKNSGNIEFYDPRDARVMADVSYDNNKKRPSSCWSRVDYTPQAGQLFFFPSWLKHGVSPNFSSEEGADAERVIISFNLNQLKRPKV